MTPEIIIKAFLEVWETQPELFQETGAVDSLESLQTQIIKLRGQDNETVAKTLKKWCKTYKPLRNEVLENSRKPKLSRTQPEDRSQVLTNRYPELYQNLNERVPTPDTENS
jgi:hypothetical protein